MVNSGRTSQRLVTSQTRITAWTERAAITDREENGPQSDRSGLTTFGADVGSSARAAGEGAGSGGIAVGRPAARGGVPCKVADRFQESVYWAIR